MFVTRSQMEERRKQMPVEKVYAATILKRKRRPR